MGLRAAAAACPLSCSLGSGEVPSGGHLVQCGLSYTGGFQTPFTTGKWLKSVKEICN